MTLDILVNELPKSYTQQDIALVRRAFEVAEIAHEGQKRKSGEPYIQHPLAVARILANLRLDSRTVAAALLHDVVEDAPSKVPDLTEEFGEEVASMVDGVTKLVGISEVASLPINSRDPKIESLRKMFLAMVGDVRVVLIKLADRLHNMRTMSFMAPEKQRRISRETLDIYAPLANALGIYQIKWELEDLAFRYLEPETYSKIERELDQNRDVREAYVKSVIETLQAALEEHGIHEAIVKGRPKHIYSIYRKMRKKGLNTSDELYDQLGIRILVPDIADCYAALGVVHTLWRPVKGEFDDYIANPKENQYRSLHTAVFGPQGKYLEVQIRTPEMDRIADIGIAAHWRYKSQDRHDEAFERKIQWLRSIIEWASQDNSQSDDFLATVKEDLFKDRVYVFTPKGDPVDLPMGATPIDFAYQIHTEVGHRCRGAKVNGKQVGLDYQLQTGEQVEIATAKRGGPSRDWLNPNLGYTKTARAKNKIKQWFRQQDRELNIAAGREMLQNELNRLGVEYLTHQEVAALFGRAEVDDFLEDLGCGELSTVDVAKKVLELGKVEEPLKEVSAELKPNENPQMPAIPIDDIAVQGVGNMLSYLARCCNAMPPDEILGFVTRGRGVAIHRRDCPNVSRLDPDRVILVSWGIRSPRTSRTKIRIQAYDRAGLLNEITGIFKEENINLLDASAVTARKDNMALITATIEVRDVEQLSRVLARISRLPNVQEVRRQKG
jgi:RelA/SpoT family (p)ppGpp synthetase